MHLACAVRARTYIYLNSSLTQMPEPFALSLPYLLSFFSLLVLCCLWTTTL